MTPQNLFVVIAAVWGVYGSYIGFQKDVTISVSNMQVKIQHLEDESRQNAEDIRELRRERAK